MKSYLYLFSAVIFEVIGTTMLKMSDGFTNLWPSVAVVVCFGLSFTLLVWTLKTLPLNLAYSVWAGLGTAGIGVIGVLFFEEILSNLNIIGLILIIVGVVVMNSTQKDEQEVHLKNVSS